jgi:hypothetical protein
MWRRVDPVKGIDFPPKRRFISQDLYGAISQKTAFFIVTAVKASNPTKTIKFGGLL